jgi:hypothetical protein
VSGGVLVDADEVAPAIGPRLGLALDPNLRTLVDAVEHESGAPESVIHAAANGALRVVPGLANVAVWNQVRAPEVVRALRVLARDHAVVVDTSAPLDDIGPATRGRYAVTRAVVADADDLVVVGHASPLGIVRLLGWIADAVTVRPDAVLHVVLNRGGASRRELDTVVAELLDAFVPESLWCLPEDPRVPRAGWDGALVADGPFTRAVADVAARLGLAARSTPRIRTRRAS